MRKKPTLATLPRRVYHPRDGDRREAQHWRDVEIRRLYWQEGVPADVLARRYALPAGYLMTKIVLRPVQSLLPVPAVAQASKPKRRPGRPRKDNT